MPQINARRKRARSSTTSLATRLRGHKGEKGDQGIPGPVGVFAEEHAEYFERVSEDITQIHKNLDIQLRRFSQVQMQMDQLRALIVPAEPLKKSSSVGLRKTPN